MMSFRNTNRVHILLGVLASFSILPCRSLNVCSPRNGEYTVGIQPEEADIPWTEPNATLSCQVSGNVHKVDRIKWFFGGSLQTICTPYHAASNEPGTALLKMCNVTVNPAEISGLACKVYDHLGRRVDVTVKDQTVCDGLPLRPGTFALQTGWWQRVPCPEFRRGEALDGVIWYKLMSGTPTRVATRMGDNLQTTNDRYGFSSDSSLLFKGVKESDEGTYSCIVIPRDTFFRNSTIEVVVIGDSFPLCGRASGSNPEVNANRGMRQTILPPLRMRTSKAEVSAVYWSSGMDISTETDIVGARFADGTVLSSQYGANYAIDRHYSLKVNSWSGVRDHQRFWCHVFKTDGSLEHYYTDVILNDQYNKPLGASESVYVLKGTKVVVPCPQWKSGDEASFIEWFKVDKLHLYHQLLFKYNVHNDEVFATSNLFGLAANFSLIIDVVDENLAGRYMCSIRRRDTKAKREEFDLHVIDNSFQVTTANESLLDINNTLQCPCTSRSPLSAISAVFWSTGDEISTKTMIGFRLANGTSRLRPNSGNYHSIDDTFSLRMMLPSDADHQAAQRLWCHVFKADHTLHSCYTNITLDQNPVIPKSCSVLQATNSVRTIVACIVLMVLQVF